MLLGGTLRLLLDVEPQRPGEDEVAAATRLVNRVLRNFPRAFQLLLADALYAKSSFLNLLLAHHKHALVVLKEERRDIYQDALGLLKLFSPQKGKYRSRDCSWWDLAELTSWAEVSTPLRVVRSEETYSVFRQADKRLTTETTGWVWVTTLPPTEASTAQIEHLGHQRWDIENHGFNELVNGWHADHVYRHEPNAIEAFLLSAFLAYNIFHAFVSRGLKPAIRAGKSEIVWARLIAADLYRESALPTSPRAP